MKKSKKVIKVAKKKTAIKNVKKSDVKKKGAFSKSLEFLKPITSAIMLLDFFAHFLIMSLSILLQRIIFDNKVVSINLPENIIQLSEQQILGLSSEIQVYFYFLVLAIIAIILAVILIWIISRAVLWRMSFRKKIDMKFILRSIPMGLIWFGVGLVPGVILLATFNPNLNIYALSIYLFVYIYFSNILFMVYGDKGQKKIFKEVFEIGISRAKDLGVAFAIVGIVFFLLSQGLNMLLVYAIRPVLIAGIVIYLFYFAWTRFYFIEVYKKRG